MAWVPYGVAKSKERFSPSARGGQCVVTLCGRDLQEVSNSCFAVFRAAMWRAHAAHWVANCFVEVYFARSLVVSIATPHVLLCLHVSFSVLEASAGAWHQENRGRVAFSRCHAMKVRCSDTPLVEKPNVVERTGASPKVL